LEALLNGKNAEELANKVIEILKLQTHWLHTITGDNRKEFAEGINIDFFFARPYHSWVRGANENSNGLISQYFPKGSSFETITNKDIEDVQFKLNNRPRKKLSFL